MRIIYKHVTLFLPGKSLNVAWGFLGICKASVFTKTGNLFQSKTFVSLLTSNIMRWKSTNTQALRELNAFESFAFEAEHGAFFRRLNGGLGGLASFLFSVCNCDSGVINTAWGGSSWRTRTNMQTLMFEKVTAVISSTACRRIVLLPLMRASNASICLACNCSCLCCYWISLAGVHDVGRYLTSWDCFASFVSKSLVLNGYFLVIKEWVALNI